MDHGAGDTTRGVVPDDPARDCGLGFEIDDSSRADLGNVGDALGAEDGREDRDGIRVDREQCRGTGEESLDGSHDLVLGCRVLRGGQRSLDVEGRRGAHIPRRRLRGDHHRLLNSDLRRHELPYRFQEPAPDGVVVGLALVDCIATCDDWTARVSRVATARRDRIGSHTRQLNSERWLVGGSRHGV